MPFTLAHPAVVWPLRRVPCRQIVPLIIGCMAPDVPDFTPWRGHFWATHTRIGTVLLDLPLGMMVLVAAVLLRGPLTELLGPRTRALVQGELASFARSPWAWILAPLSILFGTWTHLLWDSFTHFDAWGVRHFSLLETQISLGFYTGQLSHILQYASSVLGLGIMLLWYLQALASQPPVEPGGARSLQTRVLILVLTASLIIGVAQALGPAQGQVLYRVFYLLITRTMAWFGLLYLMAGILLRLRPRMASTPAGA